MARKRREIGESPETLRRLERRYQGKPLAARVRVLRLLKENPDLPIDEAAARVNYSVQGVKRWLQVYHESGIDALLGVPVRSQPPGQVERNFEVLKRKIASGEFTSMMDVACWMDSLSDTRNEERDVGGELRPEIDIPGFVVSALAMLPTSPEPKAWTTTLQAALKKLLAEVDHVTLSINTGCDILDAEAPGTGTYLVMSQNVYTGKKGVQLNHDCKDRDDAMHISRNLENLKSAGFSYDRYHEPTGFAYYFGRSAFLGTLVLWKDRQRHPMSERTIRVMERLRPFMVFLFSDFVARYRHANPERFVFNDAFTRIVNDFNLTDQERRIVLMLALGHSYEEAATTLHISINTLRHHVKSIHHKANVKSQSEFFAKYFSPRFDPDQSRRS